MTNNDTTNNDTTNNDTNNLDGETVLVDGEV